MSANDKQVGGKHYGGGDLQHWDIVDKFKLDYFQGQITKYIMRWRNKNGLEDLLKARHFLDKYIELNTPKQEPNVTTYMRGNDITELGWTTEGYLIRDGKPVQVYKHATCGWECPAGSFSEASKLHGAVCAPPRYREGPQDGSKRVQAIIDNSAGSPFAPKSYAEANPTSAYIKQGD